jgi:hypothetical protein
MRKGFVALPTLGAGSSALCVSRASSLAPGNSPKLIAPPAAAESFMKFLLVVDTNHSPDQCGAREGPQVVLI